jgi:hypothetical protein
VTDRPILFSGPMIRAILREIEHPGTGKTQTRRVLKPQPPRGDHYGKDIMDWGLSGIYQDEENRGPSKWWLDVQTDVDDNSHEEIDVRYAVGDRLWVREAWAPLSALTHNDPGVQALADRGFYRADGGTVDGEISRWRPGIHMPRWASRLTLTVTEVRVQRLQEVSEADAIAEGCPGKLGPNPDFPDEWDPSPAEEYRNLWDSINAGRAPWDSNPWVVAVTFDPTLDNIDGVRR